ncbi:MAG: IS66 family transposase [Deltaproteobacteria bacterium]|nr:IS66 family transposase [Deltaproteobacteria bacterium]
MKSTRRRNNTHSEVMTKLDLKVKMLGARNRRLEKKNERLEDNIAAVMEENRLLKLQVEEYRQKFFKKNKGKDRDQEDQSPRMPKKRGAPKGHPGKTRKKPDHVDDHVDVHLSQCPECGGRHLRPCKRFEDHYQEDIVIPRVCVTRFRHHFYYCCDCKGVVHGVGKDELPGSYIGPTAKSVASFLHYQLRIPYRPIRRLFRDLLGLDFDPSSVPGFDRQIRIRGTPLYEQLKQSLPKKPFTHADETGWRKDGINHWLWCFAALGTVVYLIDRRRSGKVVTSVLGKKYGGVLISDFLAAYNRIKSRKQRCLVHLLRLIKKWQVHFADDRKRLRYFTELKGLVKDIIALSDKMSGKRPKNFIDRKADLVGRLRRKLKRDIGYPRADKFRKKLSANIEELITCLDFDEVCSHNNWAERLLRGNVIMRKVTFGSRSDNGLRNHEVLMSLAETARLHGLNAMDFLRLLLTDPTAATAAILPAATSGR